MKLFFLLESAYIVIVIFFLVVTAIVTTREFMPKVAFKRGMLGVFTIFAVFIMFHFWMTTSRMANVKQIFNDGGTIICENKMHKTISQSILISKKLGWALDGDEFTSPNYTRNFHTARCVDYTSYAKEQGEDRQ
ncbi:MAG: hypothetical protein FAF05_04475 [Epsilonproteobacteria bacterium]|nr:hypothetical protein [Campylobacterota bacterium]